MKWYKQDTKTHTDEKIRDLIHKFGLEGYGAYIIVLELIAEKIDQNLKPEISISYQVLREILRLSHRKIDKILRFFDEKSLIFSNFSECYWNLSCPNLLKRLDNWTRNSQVTCKKPSTQQEGEVRIRSKKENILAPQNGEFLEKLKANAAYKGIDIDKELGKMDAWLLVNPHRKKTSRFVVNWLNREVEKNLVIAPQPKKERKPKSNCETCSGTGVIPESDGKKCWCW